MNDREIFNMILSRQRSEEFNDRIEYIEELFYKAIIPFYAILTYCEQTESELTEEIVTYLEDRYIGFFHYPEDFVYFMIEDVASYMDIELDLDKWPFSAIDIEVAFTSLMSDYMQYGCYFFRKNT